MMDYYDHGLNSLHLIVIHYQYYSYVHLVMRNLSISLSNKQVLNDCNYEVYVKLLIHVEYVN